MILSLRPEYGLAGTEFPALKSIPCVHAATKLSIAPQSGIEKGDDRQGFKSTKNHGS